MSFAARRARAVRSRLVGVLSATGCRTIRSRFQLPTNHSPSSCIPGGHRIGSESEQRATDFSFPSDVPPVQFRLRLNSPPSSQAQSLNLGDIMLLRVNTTQRRGTNPVELDRADRYDGCEVTWRPMSGVATDSIRELPARRQFTFNRTSLESSHGPMHHSRTVIDTAAGNADFELPLGRFRHAEVAANSTATSDFPIF